MINLASVKGLEKGPKTKELYETCVQANQTRSSHPPFSERSISPLQLVHMDTMGPLPVPFLGGAKYLLALLDDFSGLSVVRPVKAKSQISGVVQKVLIFLSTQTGFQVKNIRSDLGTEFVNSNLQNYFAEKGINHQKSAAYTPEQSGRAKKFSRPIIEKARALFIDSSLPKNLWAEAAGTANYLRKKYVGRIHKHVQVLRFHSRQQYKKTACHADFPCGHPPQYYSRRKELNFGIRNGIRCFLLRMNKPWFSLHNYDI